MRGASRCQYTPYLSQHTGLAPKSVDRGVPDRRTDRYARRRSHTGAFCRAKPLRGGDAPGRAVPPHVLNNTVAESVTCMAQTPATHVTDSAKVIFNTPTQSPSYAISLFRVFARTLFLTNEYS